MLINRDHRSFVRSLVAGFCTSNVVRRPFRRVPRDQLLLLSPRTPKVDTINILTIDKEATDSGSLEAVATWHVANPKSETMDRQAPPCRGPFL